MNTALEEFKYWYHWQGHWIYEYRSDAAQKWRTRGIIGRPNYHPSMEAELQNWVNEDPLPVMVLRWHHDNIPLA